MRNYTNISNVVTALTAVASDPGTPANISEWAGGLISELTKPLEHDPLFVKGSPAPSGVGELADMYADVRQRRLALDKESEAVKKREMELQKFIMDALSESTDTGASGKHHRVQLVEKEGYNVEDWTKLWDHIHKYKMFELLQKRLSDTALKEYIEVNDGTMPDGVKSVQVPTLSFSKV